jgi:uncharacterized protein
VKVVLDTNVLLAGLATHGLCESLVTLSFRDHRVVLSEHILSELAKHYVGKFKASPEQMIEVVALLRTQCEIVQPALVMDEACDDPDDLPILGTAEACEADYLVTGDQALREIGDYKGILIVSPRVFYELIRDRS